MKFIFEVIEGPDSGNSFQLLPGRSCALGRDSARVDYVLSQDKYISGCHCRLEARDDDCLLTHLSETNKTHVNDNVVRHRKSLRDGDILRVGFTRIRLSVKSGINRNDLDLALIRPVCCYCGRELFAAGDKSYEALGVYCCSGCLPVRADAFGKRPDLGDRYTVIRELGRGSMSIVYAAAIVLEGYSVYQIVAVKKLLSLKDSELWQRFIRSHKIFQSLRHPNLVAFHGLEYFSDIPHIIQDFSPAGTLHDLLLRRLRPLAPEDAVLLTLQIVEGLRVMHENAPPLIHRDIKPQNILLRLPGKKECAAGVDAWDREFALAQLADFDLVKRDSLTGQITSVGTGIGTRQFASPEAILDAATVTAASDLYSVGVLLYYLVTGKMPGDIPSPLEIEVYFLENQEVFRDRKEACSQLLQEKNGGTLFTGIQPELSGGIPAGLCGIINSLLKPEPEQRIQSAAELTGELEKCLE